VSYRVAKQRRAMADWVIIMSGVHAADRTYLYLAEFLHRVHNEYTCAISLANRLAARSAHEETKTALAQSSIVFTPWLRHTKCYDRP
jgi:two-component sensor histidine kinase